jgi:ABC-type multidrug transport system fused ATPase/permease subunit
VVFALSAVPLELQRRIVNDALRKEGLENIMWLALAYVAVALAEGLLKLGLNVYRGWVSSSAVRRLRATMHLLASRLVGEHPDPRAEGVEVSMVLAEAEPIGLFVGSSLSEPILQGGILLSVFGYLFFIEPRIAGFCLLLFSPELVFLPLMQRAITRRSRERVKTLREVSGAIIADPGASSRDAALQAKRIDHIFELDMGIYRLKFSMNFLMNLMHHLGVAGALGLGAWLVVRGNTEVGTVVAFVSGLHKLTDPWGDLVNWYREITVVATKYRLLVDALEWLGGAPARMRNLGALEHPAGRG